MATIDVLAASNWETVTPIEVAYYSEGDVGWTGSAWNSDGRIDFARLMAAEGKRITRVDFSYTATQRYAQGYYPAPDPILTVCSHAELPLFDGSINGLSSVDLLTYNESEDYIQSMVFKVISNWSEYDYWYEGESAFSIYKFILNQLVLTYPDEAPPFVWRDYVNCRELISA